MEIISMVYLKKEAQIPAHAIIKKISTTHIWSLKLKKLDIRE